MTYPNTEIPPSFDPATDPELAAVAAGRMRPDQVQSPTAQRLAGDVFARRNMVNPATPTVPAATPQTRIDQVENPTVRAALYQQYQTDPAFAAAYHQGLRGGMRRPAQNALTALNPRDEQQFQREYAAYAQQVGVSPNPDDPQHFYDYRGAWKAGEMTPDGNGHLSSAYKLPGHPRMFLPDEQTGQMMNTRTGEPVTGAQLDLVKNYGQGQPHVSDQAREAGMSVPDFIRSGASPYGDGEEAMRVAAVIEQRSAERQHQQAAASQRNVSRAIELNAKRIGSLPPEQWRNELDKFNRIQKRAGRDSAFLTPDDIARHNQRPYGAPTGIEGSAPDVVGAQEGGSRRGGVVQTSQGAFQVRIADGRQFGVPMLDVGHGHTLDANALAPEDFARFYTAQDAAVTHRAIVDSGMTEWSTPQRQIDAARASLHDESMSPMQRAQAKIQLQKRENELHRDFLMHNGDRVALNAQSGAVPLDKPQDHAKAIDRAQKIMEDDPSISEEDALKRAEGNISGEDMTVTRKQQKAPKEDFNPTKALSEYNRITRKAEDDYATATSGTVGATHIPEATKARDRAVRGALRQAFAEAGGETADPVMQEYQAKQAIKALQTSYRTGQIRPNQVEAVAKKIVLTHLPAYIGQLKSLEDSGKPDDLRSLTLKIASEVMQDQQSDE